MKKTVLLLIALSALLLASCEKKGAPQAQPPAQADITVNIETPPAATPERTDPAAVTGFVFASLLTKTGGWETYAEDAETVGDEWNEPFGQYEWQHLEISIFPDSRWDGEDFAWIRVFCEGSWLDDESGETQHGTRSWHVWLKVNDGEYLVYRLIDDSLNGIGDIEQ